MTNMVKQRNVTCIEWTVKTCSNVYLLLPMSSKIDSKCFIFQDRKCSLEFYTDTSSRGDARLYFKRDGSQLAELDIMVFVSGIGDSVQRSVGPERRRIRSRYEEIWRHNAGKLLGTSLTFEIFIYTRLTKKNECVQTGSYLNTNESIECLLKDFSELLDSGLNHDAEIKCGEHSVKVHKNVLCARSEVFRAMLGSDMLEGQSGIVEVQDTDISYLWDFVRYLYTGALPELTFDKAKALYELGDKYLVESLVPRCSDYLLDNLSPENACKCLALAEVHSHDKLKETAISYIFEEKVYLQDKFWLPFCSYCPKLAYEVYRMVQERGDLKKAVPTCETKEPDVKMTVLKKCKYKLLQDNL